MEIPEMQRKKIQKIIRCQKRRDLKRLNLTFGIIRIKKLEKFRGLN